MKKTVLALVCILFCSVYASAAAPGFYMLHGKVTFRDSTEVPGAFATVYSETLRSGVTAGEDGSFSLKVPGRFYGREIVLEYSNMGYDTRQQKVALGDEASVYLPPVSLVPQTLMLPAAYVTPGYDNFAEFLLTMVSKRAKENRRRHPEYSMSVDYTICTHELATLAEVFPKFSVGMAKIAAGLFGYGPIVSYALKNPDFSASVALDRSVKDGKAYDSNVRITESNAELPDGVKRNLMSCFSMVNLYSLLYSDKSVWGRNNFKKFPFSVIGSYERGDDLVHVLQWRSKNGDLSASVHVIDGVWGILKVEAGYSDRMVRCEARDIGDGFYLPVSLVISPNMFPVIRPEDIDKAIDYVQKNKDLSNPARKRILKLLKSREGQVIAPYIVGSFSVNYNKLPEFEE